MQSLKKQSRSPNPRAKASILSALTFIWTLPTLWQGYRTEIKEKDLSEPLDEHSSGPLGDKFARLWEEERARARDGMRAPSLLRVIIRAFGIRCAAYGVVLLILECGVRILQPLYLGKLVEHYRPGRQAMDLTDAYLCAAGVVISSAVSMLISHPYMMAVLHMGIKIQVACCSLIYRKSLRLSKAALGETSVGQAVNLLSNDVTRLNMGMMYLHHMWAGPLAALIMTYFMWLEIGWTATVGVAILLGFIPLQIYLGKRTSVLRLKTALRTDERVRLMNEILSGIQVIKMYTWEKPFADLVAQVRELEIKEIRKSSYIRGIILSNLMFLSRISLFCSLLAYVLVYGEITAKQVFVVTSFYNILRQSMTVSFSFGITRISEAYISVKRLETFLLREDTNKLVPGLADIQTSRKPYKYGDETLHKGEVQPLFSPPLYEHQNDIKENGKVSKNEALGDVQHKQELSARVEQDARGVRLKHATAKWVAAHAENTLTDLSLSIKPGKLIAVIGPVGAGKSSLLHVLLRELPLAAGSVHVGGSVSYASQEPWLFAGSVRQNILFGQPMDRPRYNAVVRRCALDRDFSLLPRGDKTVVGERGVSLSGGQRARISLARAVYKRADIYLLDDPLSAVDAHVGRHLFEACLVGYLRHATRILVTHQLQFLQDVDQIIILKNGTIAAAGNFDTLSASGLDFASLLARKEPEEEKPVVDSSAATDEDSILNGSFRKRQMSIHSVSSVDNLTATAPPVGGREEAELRTAGAVSGRVYGAYMRASGHPMVVALMLLVATLAQLLGSGSDWWTAYWVNQEEENPTHALNAATSGTNATDAGTLANHYTESLIGDVQYHSGISRFQCIYIYTAMVIALVVISLLRSFMFFSMAMRASTRLHNNMFAAITRAPMRFFHVNPSGRILNRFSKDMGAVDEVLPSALLDVLQIGLSLVGIVVVVAVVNYWLLLPTLAIGLVFYGLRIFYIATSRSIKRLEGVTRSPVFSHLNASLQGITTIRAFGAQEALIREFDNHQDLNTTAAYLFLGTSRAFAYWLDIVCVVYFAIVTLSFFVMGEDENGSNVGLAITQAMGLTGMLQYGMRQSTELENQMTSVERIEEYSHIESEPPLQSEPGRKPPPSWPEAGRVQFRRVFLYYAPGEPAVLRDLTLDVAPREKVGIVGRTGAGKSSLINALFRLATIEGEILIDGRDTATLGLHELRSQISIIPQEPVLFSGTMRHNLDPFDEYPDQVLWRALEEVELKETVTELPAGLNSRMSEGGSNFSVGQRQLVCLARAIVRRNRVLVLDEATANVDPQTDALIQTTIRNKFAECTVLTIAHRLHTVMDSDKVLVMDAGQMVEFDHPHVLLQKADGVLRSMVDKTGRSMADSLASVAQQAYERQHTK